SGKRRSDCVAPATGEAPTSSVQSEMAQNGRRSVLTKTVSRKTLHIRPNESNDRTENRESGPCSLDNSAFQQPEPAGEIPRLKRAKPPVSRGLLEIPDRLGPAKAEPIVTEYASWTRSIYARIPSMAIPELHYQTLAMLWQHYHRAMPPLSP